MKVINSKHLDLKTRCFSPKKVPFPPEKPPVWAVLSKQNCEPVFTISMEQLWTVPPEKKSKKPTNLVKLFQQIYIWTQVWTPRFCGQKIVFFSKQKAVDFRNFAPRRGCVARTYAGLAPERLVAWLFVESLLSTSRNRVICVFLIAS